MSENQNGKWGLRALLCGAVAAWIIYDLSTATETPRQAVMIMEYVFLAGVLIGLIGAVIKLASPK